MKISNFSNIHGFATVRGWTKGTNASGGGVSVTDGTTTVDPASSLTVAKVADLGGDNASLLPQITGTGTGTLAFSGTDVTAASASTNAVLALDDIAGEPLAELQSYHTPADQTATGIVLSVGTDNIGLRIGEKDAATVQLFANDGGGSFNFDLMDLGGTGWVHVGAQYTTPLAGIPHVYRLPFAYNTASISTGVAVGTVKSGDLILGAWIDVATAWNSVTSDAGDIVTATTGDSLLQATVNMKTAPAGTDRRKLRNGGNAYGDASVMLSDQTVNVKVTSVGGGLSQGVATAVVVVVRSY